MRCERTLIVLAIATLALMLMPVTSDGSDASGTYSVNGVNVTIFDDSVDLPAGGSVSVNSLVVMPGYDAVYESPVTTSVADVAPSGNSTGSVIVLFVAVCQKYDASGARNTKAESLVSPEEP